jgi:hypothetical protein
MDLFGAKEIRLTLTPAELRDHAQKITFAALMDSEPGDDKTANEELLEGLIEGAGYDQMTWVQ